MQIEVTEEFMAHRSEKAKLYNRRNRNLEKFFMDLDAELFEWHMINTGQWESDNDWRIDALIPDPNGYKRVDVKFISKWYNISCIKMHNILQQRHILDGYQFMEWTERPDRPLRTGDVCTVQGLGFVPYDDLIDLIQVSRGKWGGFYADVRKALMV